jgi:hypothetical protein
MGESSKLGGSLIKSLSSYYHQHHHFPHPGPDGMPEELWDGCAAAEGAGRGCGSFLWLIFIIFLFFILLLFI